PVRRRGHAAVDAPRGERGEDQPAIAFEVLDHGAEDTTSVGDPQDRERATVGVTSRRPVSGTATSTPRSFSGCTVYNDANEPVAVDGPRERRGDRPLPIRQAPRLLRPSRKREPESPPEGDDALNDFPVLLAVARGFTLPPLLQDALPGGRQGQVAALDPGPAV